MELLAVYNSPWSCCLWSCCLSFALELLFIIRPGAAVYNSPTRGSGVLENALLLRCRDAAVYGAALLQMVCAAGYLLVISAYWQFCAEWQDRLVTVDMYWQFCAEWQDRPGIITLEIMRAR